MPEIGETAAILLVEDNEDHAFLIQKALRGYGLINEIHLAPSGEEALDYLFRRDKYADPKDSPRPGLILLDIRLPGMDGLEVLKTIKQNESLKTIPVCMLTTSAQQSDLEAAYANGANSYIQKPVDFNKFVEVVKSLGLYWSMTNVPPPRAGGV
ncbi:MAG: response regulator [Armatimonadetes bacterium]|nr:response regulator [Armatimonadota bacterium]NIM23766.1 response regulator [Armatimonadota bacterium]NIM67643.1 response regulator [Armatimonadota bacterium]NIM76159.1 response regulator [Armatimonadota bacterium]NIN05844.1 response regulator [Armatimonadota bacterium]